MNILQIQSMLRAVGYTPGIQGDLCLQTQRSLKAFQRDLKLPPSGEPDWNTVQKLKRCYVNMRQRTLTSL